MIEHVGTEQEPWLKFRDSAARTAWVRPHGPRPRKHTPSAVCSAGILFFETTTCLPLLSFENV